MLNSWYRNAEKVMYNYKKNLKKRVKLYDDLELLESHGDVRVQGYGCGAAAGYSLVYDKVSDYVERKTDLEHKLEKVNREIHSVRKVMLELMNGTDLESAILLSVLQGVYIEQKVEEYGLSEIAERDMRGMRHKLCVLVSRELNRRIKGTEKGG